MSADSDALRERVKSVWLLSFGDMTTLLITFFVMMLALNYGAISRVQKWL
ncbi:flagellar motor protein MotB, partial [Sulfurivirga sp.]